MKTQIIQLDSHDDTISVKDKMGWGQTARILLVWPKHARILTRRLDTVLLQRHSTQLGAQLAFVTKDSDIRYCAELLDIPVYKSVRKAEKTHWRPLRHRRRRKKITRKYLSSSLLGEKPDRKIRRHLEKLRNFAHPRPTAWLIHPISRLSFFTLGVLGVLAIASVLVPNAEISISPRSQWQEITIPVFASPETDSIDYAGVVPIRNVNVTVEGRGQISTSGEVYIPYKRARGDVIFTNLTDRDITIPVGTVVSSSSNDVIRYNTLETITVGRESTSDYVPVEAVIPGSKGNVSADQLNAIEGPLGLELSVTNPLGISRGTDQISPAPNEEDYKILFSKTISTLHEAALDELSSRLASGDQILMADPEEFQILEEVYSPPIIQPSDQLLLALRVDFRASIVSGNDLKELSEYFLHVNLPNNFSPVSTSAIDIVQAGSPDLMDNGVYQWKIKVRWLIGATINKEEIIQLLLWQKPELALEKLRILYPIDDHISYKLSPDWWPRLPILPFRLAIRFHN